METSSRLPGHISRKDSKGTQRIQKNVISPVRGVMSEEEKKWKRLPVFPATFHAKTAKERKEYKGMYSARFIYSKK